MGTKAPYRLQTDVIVADRAILQAVASLPDYAPMNLAYNIEAVRQLEATLVMAQQAENTILREATMAREQTTEAAWAFHKAINGVKAQVEAQYGDDSPALHAVGRKRRSEHKRPARRKNSVA
jgi:hypothetical protein